MARRCGAGGAHAAVCAALPLMLVALFSAARADPADVRARIRAGPPAVTAQRQATVSFVAEVRANKQSRTPLEPHSPSHPV